MKKVLISTACLLGIFVMSSCNKTWYCSCSINGTTILYAYKDISEDQASKNCEIKQAEYQVDQPSAVCTVE